MGEYELTPQRLLEGKYTPTWERYRLRRRSRMEARKRLKDDVRHDQFTLVLGAGISAPYGFPQWDELGRRMWQDCFPDRASPWDDPDLGTTTLPQFLPIVFEETYDADPDTFLDRLRKALYRDFKRPSKRALTTSDASLAVIARWILSEFKSQRRVLRRVITFNVDYLLEEAVAALSGKDEVAVARIARATDFPMDNGQSPDSPIHVYHLHGLVPRIPALDARYGHSLIFTDAQYWASASTALSYPNRTMGMALHDSHCLFVGLSMSDVNILRWLAVRSNEFYDDFQRRRIEINKRFAAGRILRPVDEVQERRAVAENLGQHYWVRTSEKPSLRFLSTFLEKRGISTIEIESWRGPGFQDLIEEAFSQNKDAL
jgi:hypothetical protein